MALRGRPGRFLALSGDDVRRSDASTAAAAVAEGFLCRSDFRAGGDLNDVVEAFFVIAVVVPFALAGATGPDTVRAPFCLPPFFAEPFVCVAFAACRVLRFAGVGGGGGASLLTLADFLLPSLVMIVVGPSIAKGFHGGDAARDVERDARSSSLRRFAGRCVEPPSSPMSVDGSSSAFIDTALLLRNAASSRAGVDSSVAGAALPLVLTSVSDSGVLGSMSSRLTSSTSGTMSIHISSPAPSDAQKPLIQSLCVRASGSELFRRLWQ